MSEQPFHFAIGDRVSKPKGYTFDGVVVAVFRTLGGSPRVVVEMGGGVHADGTGDQINGSGLLHIFNPEQLRKEPPCH